MKRRIIVWLIPCGAYIVTYQVFGLIAAIVALLVTGSLTAAWDDGKHSR